MRKKFCDRCRTKPACKRVCKIVAAELKAKGILKCDKESGTPERSKSIKTVLECDLEGPQAERWMNIAYGAYSEPKD